MILKTIDGEQFRELVLSGANNLKANFEEVDKLNVFPVPDGDTGTNMCRTIEGGITAINGNIEKNISVLGKTLSRGMLFGARGNSGVILSQIFRGICRGFEDKECVNAVELAKAYETGVKQAYSAVMCPVEGTILTVFREATEAVLKKVNENSTINEFYETHLAQAVKTLTNTKNLLPVLKEAGVIDSGGAGYVYIVKGMIKCLDGEEIENQTLQHDEDKEKCEEVNKKIEHKKYAVVTVASGKGIKEQFESLGADYIVSGNQTMNPSTEDFINAFKTLDAEYIIVFPNNKNIIMAAKQAANLYKDAKVLVVPSMSIPQCYSALTMLDFSSDDIELIIGGINHSLCNVVTGEITTAIRTTRVHGVFICKSDHMAIVNGRIIYSSRLKNRIVYELLKRVPDIVNKQVLTVIFGKDVTEEEKQKNMDLVKSKYPYLEVGCINGEQEVYKYLLAIE